MHVCAVLNFRVEVVFVAVRVSLIEEVVDGFWPLSNQVC